MKNRGMARGPRFPKAAVICYSYGILISLVALVLMCLYLAFVSLVQLDITKPDMSEVIQILPSLLTNCFVVVVLIMKRRDRLTVVAFAVSFLTGLFSFFNWLLGNDNPGQLFGLFVFSSLVSMISNLLLAGIAACCLLPRFDQYGNTARKLWLLPGIGSVTSFIIVIVHLLSTFAAQYRHPFVYIFFPVFSIIFFFPIAAAPVYAALWLAYPYGYIKPDNKASTTKRK